MFVSIIAMYFQLTAITAHASGVYVPPRPPIPKVMPKPSEDKSGSADKGEDAAKTEGKTK